MTNQLSFRDTNFSPIKRNNQIWLTAVEIAQALGYKKTDAVTQIYDRNSDEFRDDMTETLNLKVSGNYQKIVRIFSLRGAHLIAMFARTPVAKEFRRWVLDILDHEVNQAPQITKPTTTDERTPLRDAINLLVGKKSIMYPEAYNYIHQRFGVSHIDEIPKRKIPQAIEYIHRLALDCEKPPCSNQQAYAPIRDGRVLTEYENGLVFSQCVLKDSDIVGPMETFEWIQNNAGFVVVRKELLEQINQAFNGKSSSTIKPDQTAMLVR